jgi:TPP-dependent trihydroxycyclohexane-1,2-dione (THcHDO) dehydratase
MTTMWIGNLNQYLAVRDLFDGWSTDISSEDCFKTFEEYWNRRIDSPKMCYVSTAVTRIKVNLEPEGSYYVLLQLTFESDEERTFWLLQNS